MCVWACVRECVCVCVILQAGYAHVRMCSMCAMVSVCRYVFTFNDNAEGMAQTTVAASYKMTFT